MSKHHPIAYFTMFEIFKRLQELSDLQSPKIVFVTGPDALKHGYGYSLGWKKDVIFKEGTHACRKKLGNRTATNQKTEIVMPLKFDELVAWNATLNVSRRVKNEWLHGVQHWTKKYRRAKSGKLRDLALIICLHWRKWVQSWCENRR
jgi:hypothetical protein